MKPSLFARLRIFQKCATLIFVFFLGLMAYVTFFAYSRQTGNTGLDMGKVQQMRIHAAKAQSN